MDIEEIKKKPIILISTFSTALNYMIAGIILTSITFNFGYVAYIQAIFSAVCFYLGLRLIKKLNVYFRYAYYISIYMLLSITAMNLLLMVSPLQVSTDFIYMNYFLNIIKIILITVGLDEYVKSNQKIIFGSLYVFLQILGILFQSDNIDFMIAALF